MMQDLLIEYALFNSGPWTFRTAVGATVAHRVIDTDRREIIFTGIVTPSPDRIIELCAGDQMVSIAAVDDLEGDRITWKIAMRDLVPAS